MIIAAKLLPFLFKWHSPAQLWKSVKLRRIIFTYHMKSGSQDRLTNSCYPYPFFYSVPSTWKRPSIQTFTEEKKKIGLFKE